MVKKYVLRIQNGRRQDGVLPRYVSSAEIVGDDIVIRTSNEPVYISDELACSAGQVFMECSNRKKNCQYSIEQEWRDCNSFVELPDHARYSFALAEAFRQYINLYGLDAWNNLVNGILPDQEVPGNE